MLEAIIVGYYYDLVRICIKSECHKRVSSPIPLCFQ